MDAHSEKDKQYHARISNVYDYITNEPRQYPNELLFRPIDKLLRHSEMMLDLGCGTGQMFMRYRHLANRVIAVDHSREMLAVASRKANSERKRERGDFTFVEQDLEVFLDHNSELEVGLVTCVGVLHHLDQSGLLSVMRKISTVLRTGGQCVIAEPINANRVPPIVTSRNSRSILIGRLSECMPTDVVDPDEAPLEEKDLLRAVAAAGFEVKKASKGFELFQLTHPLSIWEKLMINLIYWRYRQRGDVIALLLERV